MFESIVEFGPFRYHPTRRELQDAQGLVRIGSRALQLLAVLLESPGRLHSRDELMSRVWPQTVVEETSLRVHMSALRRVLRDGQEGANYITNVPGRGYAFIGEVQASAARHGAVDTVLRPIRPLASQRLLAPAGQLIGRGQTLEQICQLSLRERLVSVVGAGGMGKTTVALAVAAKSQESFADGAVFVDLSQLSDPALVVVELGRTHGLNMTRGEPWAALESTLREKNLLVVLDNCEHVIDAVAVMVDRLIRACPRIHVLATSREPLEVDAEWVFKLPPLDMPEPQETMGLADLLAYPAIQLFVERARAISHAFELTLLNAPAVRQLCQFLDGIPLAIELAAARVDSLGVQGLLQRLEGAFDLLTRGRRTALSRHRTLHAVLDWSYDLLSDSEKRVLQRLAVFRGAFDLESAVTVASGPDLPPQRVIEDVLGLCAKSLAVRECSGEDHGPQHRLLFITRLFAQKQLDAAPDAADVHLRHARLLLVKLVAAQKAGASMSQYRWTSALAAPLADLRAAIEWAMTQENELALGLEITAESMRTYCDSGMIGEYRRHLDRALGKLARAGVEGTRIELKLRVGETFISGNVRNGGDEQDRLFKRVRALVVEVGSVEDRIETLFGMTVGAYGQGRYRYSLTCCDEIRELAQGPLAPISIVVADRMMALNLHALGRHDEAERLIERVLAFKVPRLNRRFFSEVPFGVSMRIQLARIQWLRGHFELARATVRDALARARDAHMFALGQTLALAALPIAFWSGDEALGRRWAQELMDHSRRHSVGYLEGYAHVYEWVLASRTLLLDDAELRMLEVCVPLADTFDTLRPGTSMHPTTLARVRSGELGWSAPELLRRHALSELDPRQGDEASRRRCIEQLEQALALSEAQGARFWSLRVLLSLCHVAQAGEPAHASSRERLKTLLEAIDDGSTQPDLRQARELLGQPARSVP
ncbi:MAG TPA: winged helix-turn-helix domain-containing protein [Burkholderiaceae bacterium]